MSQSLSTKVMGEDRMKRAQSTAWGGTSWSPQGPTLAASEPGLWGQRPLHVGVWVPCPVVLPLSPSHHVTTAQCPQNGDPGNLIAAQHQGSRPHPVLGPAWRGSWEICPNSTKACPGTS